MELSQRAFMIKDYQIGYADLKEFKFIFLSFVHYLHLIKEKFPNQQIFLMDLRGY